MYESDTNQHKTMTSHKDFAETWHLAKGATDFEQSENKSEKTEQ